MKRRPGDAPGRRQTVEKPLYCLYQSDLHPKADFPVSPFLGEHGRSPPGEGHGCPFDGLKKGRGFQGDAAAWASPWSGRERLSEVVAIRGRGEASRLYSCSRSLLLFQVPGEPLCQQNQAAGCVTRPPLRHFSLSLNTPGSASVSGWENSS